MMSKLTWTQLLRASKRFYRVWCFDRTTFEVRANRVFASGATDQMCSAQTSVHAGLT